MFEVCNIFKKAEKIKKELKHEYVGTEHLLLSILDSNPSLAKDLKKYKIYYDKFYKDIDENLEKEDSDSLEYTPLLKEVIVSALQKNEKVNAKDLLLKMLELGEGVAIRMLINEDVDIDEVYNYLKEENHNLNLYKYGSILNKDVCTYWRSWRW